MICPKFENGQLPICEILLIAHVFVANDKHVETMRLGGVEKVAVF